MVVAGLVAVVLLVVGVPVPASAVTTGWAIDSAFASSFGTGFNSDVLSVAAQADGGILAGGHFTSVDGVPAALVARLNADGTVDTTFAANLGTGFNSDTVRSIVVQADGGILVGGTFTAVNGVTANRLARLNADGTVDTAFAANLGAGFNSDVFSVVVQADGGVLVGGNFTVVNGVTANRLARLNADGTVDTAFATSLGAGFNTAEVYSVAVQADGGILVGGTFTAVNGVPAAGLARLNADGTVDAAFATSLGTGFSGYVNSVVVQGDGGILAGGLFTSVNGVAVNNLARLNADGTVDAAFATSLGTGFNSIVFSVAVQADGGILAGGTFTTVDGVAAAGLAQLNADGTVDAAFAANLGTGFSDTIRSVAVQADGGILAGGYFTSVNGVTANRLARLVQVTVAIDPIPAQASVTSTPVTVQAAATSTSADPIVYAASGLPAGLSINTSTGQITGTPTAAGTSTVTVTATSAGVTDQTTFTWTVTSADPATSTIAAAPGSIPADGTSTSTVTVTVLDVNGNPVGVGGATVTMSTTLGTLSGVTDVGDGTYTATLTSGTTVGTATLGFTLDGTAGTDITTVVFTAGAPDPATSTITAAPGSIPADGASTSTVTVTVLDVNGNPVGVGGATVTMSTTLGTLGAVTDNGDGTYTATLTAGTTAGTSTLGFTLNGTAGTDTTQVVLVAGAPDPVTSTITAAPGTIPANGASTSTVTVTVLDSNGNPVGTGGAAVTMSTTLGTLGGVTDVGDGTYTATLTAGTVSGTATVGFTLNGTAGADTTQVELVAGIADETTSTITAAPATIPADGVSTSLVTVTARDVNGNPVGVGGDFVVITTDLGTIGAVTSVGDGTYTATLTSGTTAGTATLAFTLNTVPATATTQVLFTPGAPDPATSTITAAPGSIPADGTSTSLVTVTVLDVNRNPVGFGGGTVTMSTTLGTLDGVTDNGDGTYTATLTSGTTAGTTTLGFTLNTVQGTDTATVVFTAGVPDVTTSTITAAPGSIPADGTSTSLVTVTVLDSNGNPVGVGGDTVTMSNTLGALSGVTDNGDGTYTATLTSGTTAGTTTLGFTLNGTAGTATTQVAFTVIPEPATPTTPSTPAGAIAQTGFDPAPAITASLLLALLGGLLLRRRRTRPTGTR